MYFPLILTYECVKIGVKKLESINLKWTNSKQSGQKFGDNISKKGQSDWHLAFKVDAKQMHIGNDQVFLKYQSGCFVLPIDRRQGLLCPKTNWCESTQTHGSVRPKQEGREKSQNSGPHVSGTGWKGMQICLS